MPNKPIFLWGYMGAGKSRLGKRLSAKLGLTFFDLDRVIEERMNLVIPEIFNQFGEEYFRELERDIVAEFAQKTDVVLSCGGGTPCFHDNNEVMANSGLVIYLHVKHKVLVDRLWRNKTQRPLIAKMKDEQELSEFITEHLAERLPYYQVAHLTFDNTYPKGNIDQLINYINDCV